MSKSSDKQKPIVIPDKDISVVERRSKGNNQSMYPMRKSLGQELLIKTGKIAINGFVTLAGKYFVNKLDQQNDIAQKRRENLDADIKMYRKKIEAEKDKDQLERWIKLKSDAELELKELEEKAELSIKKS